MAIIYFLTETRLRELTPINLNVDTQDIIFNIRNISDMYIKSILGTYFYNDLLTKYNNQTMSSDELLLLDYIQPSIAWGSCAESVITTSYQIKNKGVQTQTGDFSANAEYKENMFLVHHYQDKRDFYLNTLKNYLKENKELYSNFISDLNKDSIIKDCKQDALFNSNIMFIGKSDRNNGCNC